MHAMDEVQYQYESFTACRYLPLAGEITVDQALSRIDCRSLLKMGVLL
jgi:hypothetical protein